MNNIYEEEHCSDSITMFYKSKVCPPLTYKIKLPLKRRISRISVVYIIYKYYNFLIFKTFFKSIEKMNNRDLIWTLIPVLELVE